jgi:hypothetical protein
MLGGADAKFVGVKVKGPPNAPVVIFCNVRVAGFGALVNVQTIFANSLRLIAGTVIVLPDNVPKLAGLPDVAALVSVQVPAVKLKLILAASVRVTGFVFNDTVLLTVADGAAIPAAVVVMVGGAPVKFVAVKLNGPPANPVVIF